MKALAVANRYAKSLLDLSIEQNQLEDTVKDLNAFEAVLENRDLTNLLRSPIVKADKKLAVYSSAFSAKFNKLTNSFFELLIKKGRENIIPEIIASFKEQYNTVKGVSGVTITSATPIDDATIEAIKKRLAASSETKQNIDVEMHVDPELIGGFTIAIGDKLYDASVAHKLEQLRKEFEN